MARGKRQAQPPAEGWARVQVSRAPQSDASAEGGAPGPRRFWWLRLTRGLEFFDDGESPDQARAIELSPASAADIEAALERSDWARLWHWRESAMEALGKIEPPSHGATATLRQSFESAALQVLDSIDEGMLPDRDRDTLRETKATLRESLEQSMAEAGMAVSGSLTGTLSEAVEFYRYLLEEWVSESRNPIVAVLTRGRRRAQERRELARVANSSRSNALTASMIWQAQANERGERWEARSAQLKAKGQSRAQRAHKIAEEELDRWPEGEAKPELEKLEKTVYNRLHHVKA